MKTFFTFLLIGLSLFSFSQVRISQVYGGGGNPSATYNRDFVELFNAGAATVDISNWSVQYASATGPVAPGDWAVTGIPAGNSIAPGKYFLIALASGGAVGAALPATDFLNNGINISNTAGKIALVTNATALNGTTACGNAAVVDVIGYGATATCFETAAASTAGIDNTMSIIRGLAGCTETNNNSNDFSIGLVTPRNSSSAVNSCGPPVAFFSASPNALNITGSAGSISPEQTFTLSGSNLTGFPGNISVTASAGLEISLTSGSGFATSVNVPYTAATLAATTIYVHITAAAPAGALNGTVTNSGGGAASNAIVTVTGGLFQNYYNTKANNGLTDVTTWSSTADGLGASPTDFTSAYQLFNIIDQTNAFYGGVWNVTGAGNTSRVVVGDGSTAINLIIPDGADSITSATRVDVLNNATLTIQNNRRPFLNNLATGSTVDFAQAGVSSTDTIHIPNISFYNLKLTGGLKYFSGNTTTIRGNLVADAVVSMNGSSPTFSTINAFGDVSFINGTQFEPLPSGDAARFTLAMNGSDTQHLVGTNIYLFRLQRDSTSSNSVITTAAQLFLGNNAGGGLRLNQGTNTTTVLNLGFVVEGGTLSIVKGGSVTTSANGKIYGNGNPVTIAKSSGNSNAGTLRFTRDAVLDLAINFDPSFARDSVMIGDSAFVQNLLLIKGKVIVDPNAALTMTDGPLLAGGHISGGSASSFVEGKLRRAGFQSIDFHFPVGKGDKYAPVDVLNTITEDITVEYFFNDYGDHTIDPATLSTYPDYNVSYHEYWVITNNGITIPDPDIVFHYTDGRSGVLDPPQVKIAHFDGTDWNDLGGTADADNTTSVGFVTVTGVNTFSPFTFSARTTGVLPVKLTSFTAQKQNSTVKLNWITSQETNSSHFIVQRSFDNRKWTDMIKVDAAGYSSSPLNYTTIDYTPGKGMNFYRLKQYDRDNRFDYSLTRTAFFSAGFEVAVTPNPSKDFINIYISKNNTDPATILLTDMIGRPLKHFSSADSFIQISTIGMAKGMYVLKVTEGDKVATKQVLINN